MRAFIASSFALVAVACTASIPDARFSCESTADCPPDFTCREGLCHATPSDSDAGPGADAAPPSDTDGCVARSFFRDADSDGFGDADDSMTGCVAPDGYVDNDADCDDACESCNPDGVETCDGADNDCDGATDDGALVTFYRDADEDGFGAAADAMQACAAPSGYVDNDDDCDDECAECHPGAAEVCEGMRDEDCSLGVDDGCRCTTGLTRDCPGGSSTGVCMPGSQTCQAGEWSACVGAVAPRAETCNGLDDDCDTVVDGPVASTACGTPTRAVTAACSAGSCAVTSCDTGWGDCDARCTNGCETDVTRTLAHCGRCGNACGWSCGGAACDDPVELALGEGFSCARLASGRVACWGGGSYGQLGRGTTRAVNDVPAFVVNAAGTGPLTDVVDIDAGREHACAVTGTGNVYCWGSNSAGQLGDGTTTQRLLPVQVRTATNGPALPSATQVVTGDAHSCALRSDGRVFCWGAGGLVGDGTMTARSYAVEVVQLSSSGGNGMFSGIAELGVGTSHTCARTRVLGNVYCWGSGAALGNGTFSNVRAVPVSGMQGNAMLSGATRLSVGGLTSCAHLPSGVVCWGGWSTANTPVTVPGVGGMGTLQATSVRTGESHRCAATASDGLVCAGGNGVRQLGDGTTTTRNVLTRVIAPVGSTGNLGAVIDFDVGVDHTCAIQTSGRVVCFGANELGQIGILTSGSQNPTVAVSPQR